MIGLKGMYDLVLFLSRRLPFYLQGYGEQALYILDRLADNALKGVSFTWRKPEPPMDDNQVQFGFQWMAERLLYVIHLEVAIHR